MLRTTAISAVIPLLLCSCGTSITYTPMPGAAAYHRRRPVESVDVYLSGPPTQPHRDVGLLEAEQDSDLSLDGTREMLHKLRVKAAHVGCDAISLNGVGSRTEPALAVDINHASSVKTITATCIRYVERERADDD